jgi:UDP-N-acetylmuramoyl-tripeptide--D-alanyl-D-alanine ligase
MIKKAIKFLVVPLLVLFARAVIHRYKPRILMVSGSVGKTSTKDAIASVLAPHFFIRKSDKSFNSELGVPFTVLGVENPWNNPLSWLKVFKAAFALLVLPNHYPNLLVLEVGADQPGDLARILRIATPDVVVVTRLPEIPVHVEAYASPEAVREEEFSPAHALPAGAPLIIPSDDPYALDSAMRTSTRIITYGTTPDAMVRLSDIGFHEEHKKVIGMKASVYIDRAEHSLFVKGSVGTTQLLPAAAALAVASAFDIPAAAALKALESYEPPPGRGRILEGMHGSVIIDDSYNASPAAVEEALTTLKTFPYAKRRIAVLGDMLELGRYSIIEHDRIGKIAQESADIVVAVGIRARAFAVGKGVETMAFDNSGSAAEVLATHVKTGDVILIKGSQSIRMERIVKALLANPADATRIVRQNSEWQKR